MKPLGYAIAGLALALTACGNTGAGTAPPSSSTPTSGAAALAAPVTSLEDVAKLVQNLTGECANARRSEQDYLDRWFDDATAAIYRQHVAEWAQCKVGSRTVSMFLFKQGQFAAFQTAWRDALQSGKIQGPSNGTGFGNGYAVDAAPEHIASLGLLYLRCRPVEQLNARKVPSDVDGCVFSDVDGH